MSEYRKTKRGKCVYESVTGKIDITEKVSEEWREWLRKADNRIVENNVKNGHPQLTPEQKAEKKDWEEAHPGEKFPANWNLAFDGFSDDPDLDDDKQPILPEALKIMNPEDGQKDWLHEMADFLPADERKLFEYLIEKDMSIAEIAATHEFKSTATVYRLTKKMTKHFIELKVKTRMH